MRQHTWGLAIRTLAVAAMLVVTGLSAPAAFAEKYASIVIDTETHEVLHARNADAPRYPASLTKVMTLYMLFDAINAGDVSVDEKLTVSRFAASQAPSNLKLKPGSTISVSDAIGALVTKSANDVAVVVAERLGGTESRFAQLMTVKAKSLGMPNTRFVNASGLPDDRQITTARDLAVLAEAMIDDHGESYHHFSRPRFSWAGKTYKNHNELLETVDGVDGIKTGYTRASGFNLMTSAKRDGHRIIAIMLGGSTSKSRNAHVASLVEAAFKSYELPADPADPNRRLQMAFSEFNTTTANPNGAAVPMLNGKPLGTIQPAASPLRGLTTITKAPAKKVEEAVEASVETDEETAEEASEILMADAGPAAEEAMEFEQGDATPTSFVGATVVIPAGRPAFTVNEYEARQFGN
ncbi:MAG: D-alanyl-D-alanine carboxypeptidase family protein [Hyphomonas sp.]|uniref:D-alanyl-D-alanine carboxypeptidase family protein n=1 Tax=Hyphomonas sp. TaxID=87 RepID=UPI003001D9B9